jgi:hypothetical protein
VLREVHTGRTAVGLRGREPIGRRRHVTAADPRPDRGSDGGPAAARPAHAEREHHADRLTGADTDADADADLDTDTDRDTDAHAGPHADADGHAITDGDTVTRAARGETAVDPPWNGEGGS